MTLCSPLTSPWHPSMRLLASTDFLFIYRKYFQIKTLGNFRLGLRIFKCRSWLSFLKALWLCWVFVSVWGLSLVVASEGHSSSRCAGLSSSRPLLLWSTGSRRAGSVIVAHGPSRSVACGIFPDRGTNPCPLHWQADSQPLRHQGSPNSVHFYFLPFPSTFCSLSHRTFSRVTVLLSSVYCLKKDREPRPIQRKEVVYDTML